MSREYRELMIETKAKFSSSKLAQRAFKKGRWSLGERLMQRRRKGDLVVRATEANTGKRVSPHNPYAVGTRRGNYR